jgi:hypothetical protein
MEKTPETLRYIRKARLHMDQKAFAAMIGGITFGAIGNYERKEREIPEWIWSRLSELGHFIAQKPQCENAANAPTEGLNHKEDAIYYRGQADMAQKLFNDMVDRIGKVLERTEVALSSKQ